VTTSGSVTTSTSGSTVISIASATPTYSYPSGSLVRGSVGQTWGSQVGEVFARLKASELIGNDDEDLLPFAGARLNLGLGRAWVTLSADLSRRQAPQGRPAAAVGGAASWRTS
jgi:hypothetical protein